jgi:hypothetical protein
MSQPSKSNEEIVDSIIDAECVLSLGDYKRYLLKILEAKDAEIEKKVEELKKDKERLDFLDRCNLALNDHYKTNYGWKLILNHNVTRLMSEGSLKWVDLNDAEGGNDKHKSCRDAIDKYLTPPRG